MFVKNFLIVSKKGNEILIDVEVNNITWGNDSIGWYEYWGHQEYDCQPDYIEDFEIGDIYIHLVNSNKPKKIHHKKILDILSNYLYKNDSFKKIITKLAKIYEEEVKIERLIDAREERKLYW